MVRVFAISMSACAVLSFHVRWVVKHSSCHGSTHDKCFCDQSQHWIVPDAYNTYTHPAASLLSMSHHHHTHLHVIARVAYVMSVLSFCVC